MKINAETVRSLCELARLRLDPEEAERMRRDLERILDYAEALSELDTRNVPPTAHVLDIPTPARVDEVEGQLAVDEALRNAPRKEGHAFVVPKVIE